MRTGKLVALILVAAMMLFVILIVWMFLGSRSVGFGLVYHHPTGDWTNISKIHWLGSPSQFALVNATGLIETDFARIRAAGYASMLFHVCVRCLDADRVACFPTDFDYAVLKRNLEWMTGKAKNQNFIVYVLYYPDFNASLGDYYEEGSDNWNLMVDFTSWCVSVPSIDYCAPFGLTDNTSKATHFFAHLGLDSPKVLVHADQPSLEYYLNDGELSAYPKLLELYGTEDAALMSLVRDAGEHVITGQRRGNTLNQSEQVDSIRQKVDALGEQENLIVWCYADYPDSSYDEDLGLVQSSAEDLPQASTFKP